MSAMSQDETVLQHTLCNDKVDTEKHSVFRHRKPRIDRNNGRIEQASVPWSHIMQSGRLVTYADE